MKAALLRRLPMWAEAIVMALKARDEMESASSRQRGRK